MNLRQLWFDLNAEKEPQKLEPHVLIKFLYGHLLEEVLLFLVGLYLEIQTAA